MSPDEMAPNSALTAVTRTARRHFKLAVLVLLFVLAAGSAIKSIMLPNDRAALVLAPSGVGEWLPAPADMRENLLMADRDRIIVRRDPKGVTLVREEWLTNRVVRTAWAGARNDGVQDDAPAIMAAAGLVSRLGGGTLDLGTGIIGVRGRARGVALILTRLTNVTLRAHGAERTQLRLLGAAGFRQVRVLTLAGNRGLRIEGGLSIDGNQRALSNEVRSLVPEQMAGVFLLDNDGVVLNDLRIANVGGDAIRLGGSRGNADRNIVINRAKWSDCGRNGITLGGFGFENILIDRPVGGPGVDTQQIDFEPLGGGIFRNVQIRNALLSSTGGDRDDFSLVISGRLDNGQVHRAQTVRVTGGRLEGAVLIRHAQDIVIEKVEQIASDNPHRAGVVQVDFGSRNVRITGIGEIVSPPAGPRRLAAVYIRAARGMRPASIAVVANRLRTASAALLVEDADQVSFSGNEVEGTAAAQPPVIVRARSGVLEGLRVEGNNFSGGFGSGRTSEVLLDPHPRGRFAANTRVANNRFSN